MVVRDGVLVPITETWERTHTESVAGFTISYFTETWTAEEFVRIFKYDSFGVDDPNLPFGRLSVPGQPGALGQPEPYLMVRAAPMSFSTVPVHRINDRVQYSSHLVNLRVDDFAVGRVAEGNEALRVSEAANLFFVHFEDEYDSIAFVTQRQEMGLGGGLFKNVRNDIEGIGLPIFDDSAAYGSGGRLQGVEYFGAAWIANQGTSSHELMHRWGDYFRLHEIAGVDSGGLHYPEAHAPLLFPHESFLSGAGLKAHLEVVRSGDGAYQRAIVPAPRQHPLHLYAMGLAPASSVPELLVFEEQRLASIVPGGVVPGPTRAITMDALLARHGPRVGPVQRQWRRAVVVVSTGGLLAQEEMNFWNFVAKRLSARSDATDFWGVPSFYASVHRRMELLTDIVPRQSPKLQWMEATTKKPYSPESWWGLVFDEPVPTVYSQGETYTLSGRVTVSEATQLSLSAQTVEENYSGADSFRLRQSVGEDRRSSVTFQFPAAGSYKLSADVFDDDGEGVVSARTGILVFSLGADPEPPPSAGPCKPSAESLCLHDGRFEVRVEWWTGDGERGSALVVSEATKDSGLFRFFDEDNWEILVKVLDGCAANGHYWVYGASTTDLGYSIRVRDTRTADSQEYGNEPGQAAPAMTDARAFSTACQETAADAAQ